MNRRLARRERLRRSEATEAYASRRTGYFYYGLSWLCVPIAAFLYGGLPALGIGSLVALALATYFIRASRVQTRQLERPTSADSSHEVSAQDAYRRNLERRSSQGRSR